MGDELWLYKAGLINEEGKEWMFVVDEAFTNAGSAIRDLSERIEENGIVIQKGNKVVVRRFVQREEEEVKLTKKQMQDFEKIIGFLQEGNTAKEAVVDVSKPKYLWEAYEKAVLHIVHEQPYSQTDAVNDFLIAVHRAEAASDLNAKHTAYALQESLSSLQKARVLK